jgi:hypothetical protein
MGFARTRYWRGTSLTSTERQLANSERGESNRWIERNQAAEGWPHFVQACYNPRRERRLGKILRTALGVYGGR